MSIFVSTPPCRLGQQPTKMPDDAADNDSDAIVLGTRLAAGHYDYFLVETHGVGFLIGRPSFNRGNNNPITRVQDSIAGDCQHEAA